jgi:hypothetical protein
MKGIASSFLLCSDAEQVQRSGFLRLERKDFAVTTFCFDSRPV